MKTLKFFIAIMAITISTVAFAANKTESIKVSGNCESCKSRIEKAAKVTGVTKAQWSEKTKVLTLVFDSTKVTSVDVQKKIAAVGHDTPNFKATSAVYNTLPACCKYR
ncbi:MAG: heavy-metal-associated domain-containing protein, partial [Paludibacter sp.]